MLQKILLFGMGLLFFGGWFSNVLEKRSVRIACAVAAAVLLMASYLPTIRTAVWRVEVEAVLLIGFVTIVFRHGSWARIAIASVLGGLAAWKLCDLYPMFAELGVLMAIPILALGLLYCRTKEERAVTAVLSPLIASLCLSIADYSAFGFCAVSIGTEDGMVASLIVLLSLLFLYPLSSPVFL